MTLHIALNILKIAFHRMRGVQCIGICTPTVSRIGSEFALCSS